MVPPPLGMPPRYSRGPGAEHERAALLRRRDLDPFLLPFFKERYGAKTVTGARVGNVQATFRDIFNLGPDFAVDGRPFDVLTEEDKSLRFGSLEFEALHTPR